MSGIQFLRTAMEAVLEREADPLVLAAAVKAIEDGTHKWTLDPDVEGVVGLIRVGSNTADIVVYAGVDFELSRDWEDGLGQA